MVDLLTRVFAWVIVAAALSACAPTPNGSPDPYFTKAPYTLAPPTPTLSAQATVGPTGAGQPYTADLIQPYLNNAPISFPNELRVTPVAEAIADRIWTFDGRPYRDVVIGGSCEGSLCEVSVTGLPAFSSTPDEADFYALTVDRGSGLFSDAGEPLLRGFPTDLVPQLDAIARAADSAGRLRDLALLGSSWRIPPPNRAFTLEYGMGLEERDPVVFVTVDLDNGAVIAIRTE